MSEEEFDPDKTLREYGYGRSGKGKTIAIVILALLLVAATGSAIFVGKLWSTEQSKVLALESQVNTFTAKLSELENKNAELSSLLADKQAETERIKEEWTTQVETLEDQHKEQLQRTYGQMNEIVYDSRKTLEYIGDIETRLRDGQNLDKQEAGKLTGVINGLAFLHEQYKKPLNEFRELDRYFTQQLSTIPADQVDPLETTPLGKRIFKNKEFKKERAQYFEDQGRRSALEEAKTRVSSAYASAQRQMAGVSLDINQYLAQLDQVVESNERSVANVDEFFEKSKEILKIHDKIMSIEPPQTPTIRP
ncbi:MAG: hypothetical protein WD342_06495 [Verrucomicrobiales bacterium]